MNSPNKYCAGDLIIDGQGVLGIDLEGSEDIIHGLEHLVAVGGSVSIVNTQLWSLQGLEALQYIGSNLVVDGNPYMGSLQGIHNLEVVQEEIHIQASTPHFWDHT